MKAKVIEMIKKMAGNDYLYLDSPLIIKKTPHTPPVNLLAISVGPDQEIYLMDAEQEWFRLEESDCNYQLVIATVFQRVMTIYKKVLTA